MLSSKQRAALRGCANRIETIFQVGKSGIGETLICQVDEALTARELIKLRVLENSELTPREAATLLCEKLRCEPVQVIGSRFVLYRRNPKAPAYDFCLK